MDFNSKIFPGIPLVTKKHFFQSTLDKILVGTVAAILVIAAAVIVWLSIQPGLSFNKNDKLLIADVENRTGDSVFDLALRTAIEADLQQSSYASIFDKGQVAETLRYMRKDSSAPIDEELGSDICRFAGVRALILPKIISAGDAYELQAILMDPIRKRYVDRIRVTARGKEEVLLHAVDDLARKVRSRLGETIDSIQEADIPVVKVTTSSWEALRYLTLGQTKWHEGKLSEAAKFFELALEKDPHFPTARGSLGLVLIQFLNQKEKGKEMLRQALLDAEGIPQQEYLMIRAANKQFVDEDLDGALAEYRMINELYPDIFTAYNNAGLILRSLGRLEESVTMFKKAIERAPHNSLPLFNLYFTYMQWMKDPKASEEAASRLLELDPQMSHFLTMHGWSLVAQGRFSEAIEDYRKAWKIEPQHPYALPNLAHLLLATGSAKEAVPLYQNMHELTLSGKFAGQPAKSGFDLAFAMNQSGDIEGAKKIAAEGEEILLKKVGKTPFTSGNFLIMAQLEIVGGRMEEAKSHLSRALSMEIKDPQTLANLAEVYALLGEDTKAIETLKRALDSGYPDFFFPLIFPAFQSIRNNPDFKALFNISDIT
ncbi:MAG: tetratricopeptide repeat protein [Acidobacteriota bacterium]